jgi:hypothetical protein
MIGLISTACFCIALQRARLFRTQSHMEHCSHEYHFLKRCTLRRAYFANDLIIKHNHLLSLRFFPTSPSSHAISALALDAHLPILTSFRSALDGCFLRLLILHLISNSSLWRCQFSYLVRLEQDTHILLWQTLETGGGAAVVRDQDEKVFFRETGSRG